MAGDVLEDSSASASTAVESVLSSSDLVGLVIAFSVGEDGGLRTDSQPPLQHASLSRSLRLRLISQSWEAAIKSHLSNALSLDLSGATGAILRSLDSSGNPLVGLKFCRVVNLSWGLIRLPPPDLTVFPALTALSLRHPALTDGMLAAVLASVSRRTRLRSLCLSGAAECFEATLSVVQVSWQLMTFVIA